MLRNCLTWLILVGMLHAEIPREEQLKQELGSGDFNVRQDATITIWREGDRALGFLKELALGDDPEIALRAGDLVLKIRSGLKPETSADVVELVGQFFATKVTLRSKIAVLEKLQRLEKYEFIMRLRSLEDDRLVIERADDIIKEVLPILVKQFASEGKYDEVKSLLRLGTDYQSMIAYANLLDQLGELEQEIERLRIAQNSQDQQRYLACLRVQGDASLLLEEAQRLGDEQAIALASLILGNHLPYFQYLLKHRSVDLSARKYLDWTIATGENDLNEADKIVESIVHLTQSKEEVDSARMYLLRMGLPELVLEGVKDDEVDFLYSYYLGQEQYGKVLSVFGLVDDQLTEEWLNDQREQISRSQDRSRIGARLGTVASFYESRGMLPEAVRCCQVLVDAVRGDEDTKLSSWFSYLMNYCPKAGLLSLANEVDHNGYDLSLAIDDIFRSSDFQWTFSKLKELYPEQKLQDALMTAASFGMVGRGSGHVLFVAEKVFEDVQNRILEEVLSSSEKQEGLKRLFSMARFRDCEKDLLRFGKLLDESGEERPLAVKGQIEVTRMRFKEAGEVFQKVEYDANASGFQLYYKGAALRKAGLVGGEDLCRKGLLLSKGGSEELVNYARIEGQFHFDQQASEYFRKALLRLDLSDNDTGDLENVDFILSYLAADALKSKSWKVARSLWEAVAWHTDQSGAIYNLRSRFYILLSQGALARQSNDLVGAVKALSRAHAIIPRDGYLANDFFPLLRELGFNELHDQLFATSARECRAVIRKYPKDDNAYNNFGWLASRANRCLDEAAQYMEEALRLEPRSSAYLDTLGEIYFAQGDREQAVRWSDLSRSYELSDVELQSQNLRFRFGAFPLP